MTDESGSEGGVRTIPKFLTWSTGHRVWPVPETGKAGGTGFLGEIIICVEHVLLEVPKGHPGQDV